MLTVLTVCEGAARALVRDGPLRRVGRRPTTTNLGFERRRRLECTLSVETLKLLPQ